jgi:hypothetical protein
MFTFGHPFLSQHLFEHAAELLAAEPIVRILGVARGRGPETKRAPWEATAWSLRAWYLLVGFPFRVRGRCAAGERAIGAGSIVVAAASGVAECIVGVVYLLEFLGSRNALGGVGRDAVGVVLQGCSMDLLVGYGGMSKARNVLLVGIPDLLLCRFGVYLQRGICEDNSVTRDMVWQPRSLQ